MTGAVSWPRPQAIGWSHCRVPMSANYKLLSFRHCQTEAQHWRHVEFCAIDACEPLPGADDSIVTPTAVL